MVLRSPSHTVLSYARQDTVTQSMTLVWVILMVDRCGILILTANADGGEIVATRHSVTSVHLAPAASKTVSVNISYNVISTQVGFIP